jgi:hypothetical protein
MPEELRNAEQIGELRGRMTAQTEQLAAHQKATETRFNRIEDKIESGFRQSQLDREAGNKTLGEMITALEERMTDFAEIVAKSKGERALGERIFDFIGMIFGGCGVGIVLHILGAH